MIDLPGEKCMAYPPHINSLSIQSVYIEILLPSKEPSSATGFFIRSPRDKKVAFLATARHVLTGSDVFTNGIKYIPCALRVWVPLQSRIDWRAFEITLTDENSNAPKWIDHKTVNHLADDSPLAIADVALLPLNFGDECDDLLGIPYTPCEREFFADWQRSIGSTQFICGFPIPRTAQKLAITVAVSVASEPNVDFHYRGNYYPFYLVSGRMWYGQSGSPVLPYPSVGAGSTGDGKWAYAAGASATVVGLYSSRLILSETETSDLGIVWHADILSRLAAAYTGNGHAVNWIP